MTRDELLELVGNDPTECVQKALGNEVHRSFSMIASIEENRLNNLGSNAQLKYLLEHDTPDTVAGYLGFDRFSNWIGGRTFGSLRL